MSELVISNQIKSTHVRFIMKNYHQRIRIFPPDPNDLNNVLAIAASAIKIQHSLSLKFKTVKPKCT